MKKILFIRVPEIEYNEQSTDVRNVSVASLTIPLGITYLAAMIIQDGRYDVKILDLYAENYLDFISEHKEDPKNVLNISNKKIIEYISRYQPDIIGFSALFLFQHSLTKELIATVKRNFPHIKIHLGGYPTIIPEIVMKDIPELDVLFIGESENSIIQVLDAETKGNNFYSIDGIAFRDGKKVQINKSLNLVKDLDTLPFPAFDLLPLEKYKKIIGKNEFPLMTTRGCPFSCAFCSSKLYSKRGLRVRSVTNLLEEMEILRNKYAIDFLMIRDDNFIVNKGRTKKFLQAVIKRNLTVPWLDSSGFHVNSIDEELLDLCKATGCKEIIFAIESGSPRVLKEIMNKNVNLEHAKRMAEYCRKIDLLVQCYFVIGNPGETREEIMQTIEFAKEIQVDHCTFSLATPFPGTQYYDIAIKNNYLIHDSDYILGMKYMEANMETENFTPEWLKDTQYDANIKVNFLENKNLSGSKETLTKSRDFFARVYQQYNFHAVAHLIEGYLEGRLGDLNRQNVIFEEVRYMLQEEYINKAYAKYIEWDTAPTNCYWQWLESQKTGNK